MVENVAEVSFAVDGRSERVLTAPAAFTVAALGMIGVPPLAGYITKWYLKKGAITAGDEWVAVVLAVSSLRLKPAIAATTVAAVILAAPDKLCGTGVGLVPAEGGERGGIDLERSRRLRVGGATEKGGGDESDEASGHAKRM